MTKLDKIVEDLSKLTIIEASDLAKRLEEKWGVSGQQAVVAAVANDDSTKKDKPSEKLEYDVILDSVGDKRINVIKEIKAITGLGLQESKTLVMSVPKPVKTSVPKDEAEKLKERLESVGAKVILK